MKFRNQFLKYKLNQKEGDDSGDGGGGGGEDQTAVIADLQSQLTKVLAKNDELLGETKAAKKAREEAESLAKTSSEDALKKAGDFEQLYKSQLEQNEELKTGLTERDKRDADNNISKEALNIAFTLADNIKDGAQNATILSSSIKSRLKFVDGELKVTDKDGNLTVSSLEDLQREFANNPAYSGLLKGNQSSGGGANGDGNKGGGAAKEMARSDFDNLSQSERKKFALNGGKVI